MQIPLVLPGPRNHVGEEQDLWMNLDRLGDICMNPSYACTMHGRTIGLGSGEFGDWVNNLDSLIFTFVQFLLMTLEKKDFVLGERRGR